MPRQDDRYLDAIDRALDGSTTGADLNSGDAIAISRLRILAAATRLPSSPHEAGMRTTSIVVRNLQQPSIRSLWSKSRTSVAATVALVVLLIALGTLVSKWTSDHDRNAPLNSMAAAGTPEIPTTCTVKPRNGPFPGILAGGSSVVPAMPQVVAVPNDPTVSVVAVRESDLNSLDVPSTESSDGAIAALTERVGCRNSFALGWSQAILPDPTYSGEIKHDVIDGTPVSYRDGSLFYWQTPVPEILRIDALGEQTVGLLLASDLYGYGLMEYDVYTNWSGQWSLLESKLVIPDLLLESLPPVPLDTITLRIWDMWPGEFSLAANTPVSIRVINNTSDATIFEIPDLAVWEYLEPGDSVVVQINVPVGTYAVSVLQPGRIPPLGMARFNLVDQDASATPVS